LDNLNSGKQINLKNKNNSTRIKEENNTVLAVGLSQRKYSINKVTMKYSNPIPIKKTIPFSN
jgi:hypothetical protein